MAAKKEIIIKTGKKKTSVARASVLKGTGKIIINNEDLDSYFPNNLQILKVKEPLVISNSTEKFDVKIKVFGGGITSQTDAIRQAIARALVEILGEGVRKDFLDYDRSLLVSDTRFKEMKKPNNSHARAKRQKSYR